MEMETQSDWLKWRQKGIGGSDAPIIMGQSDWCTPIELYNQKIADEVVESEGNFATKLGNEAEPKIRSLHELVHGKSFKPCLCQSGDFEFLRASLDGRTDDKVEISEYKLLNKKDWEIAKKWFAESKDPKEAKKYIPLKYYTQIQHIFMTSPDSKKCWFVAYLFGEYKSNRKSPLSTKNLAMVEVHPDPEYQTKILMEETKFWQQHVLKKKPPMVSSNDVVKIDGNKKKVDFFLELSKKHEALTKELAKAEKELKQIAEQSGYDKVDISGIKISKVSTSGRFSVLKVPAAIEEKEKFDKKLKEIEESLTDEQRMKFTSNGSISWRLTKPKTKKEKK
jgi:putative phage-type endonuclease